LAKAIAVLKEASKIWITGEFTSFDLAAFLSKSLDPTVGIPAAYFHPSIAETAAVLNEMEAGDAVLALALGLPGLDTGYAIRSARAKGLTTVCITNSGTVLPAREADVTVVVPTKSPIAGASFNLSLMMVSVIWEALVGTDAEKTADAFTNVHSNMSDILELRSATEDYEIPKPESDE
jgi:DNA-binding MurR/RpiR family transcriptional regulator